ncbi:hypothetical protein Hanom_Chr03g00242361 [Helianthus anomalus]
MCRTMPIDGGIIHIYHYTCSNLCAVVIEWKSRSYVVWVSELQDRWSPVIDNDKSSESSDSGSGSDADEMEDDTEEGEITPDPKDDQNKNEHGGNG